MELESESIYSEILETEPESKLSGIGINSIHVWNQNRHQKVMGIGNGIKNRWNPPYVHHVLSFPDVPLKYPVLEALQSAGAALRFSAGQVATCDVE